MRKVLAVASFGGHWKQLLRLAPVFGKYDTTYVSTVDYPFREGSGYTYFRVPDASRKSVIRMFCLFFTTLRVVFVVRPDVVISTGAGPGLVTIFWGRVFGCRTIWIDSVANPEQLSFSGKIAKRWADLWLTQWPELVRSEGPMYKGRVI
ncbi:glycosyltransferase family protein [Microbulbifer celer]|uniref:Uncharacterized protein n=1 Tax=Microbulbifer celer TaxID=435905 RepID=A0ABW3U4B6_9GAMM|nr:hypothetical protein [Microbulbifer celer]UFN58083.1 hypothetical protein LPW13_03275 [Microbulbifer celer]